MWSVNVLDVQPAGSTRNGNTVWKVQVEPYGGGVKVWLRTKPNSHVGLTVTGQERGPHLIETDLHDRITRLDAQPDL